MEELMERVLFHEIATPADLHEHHKWARRVGAFYGILFLGGIGFVVVHHHYQPTNQPAVTSFAAINHLQR
jgi:preprotein translocase subunit Sss1